MTICVCVCNRVIQYLSLCVNYFLDSYMVALTFSKYTDDHYGQCGSYQY